MVDLKNIPARGFNPNYIEGLRWKADGGNEVSDPVTPGLRLRVLPSGRKVFRWATRDAEEKLRWITLGPWDESGIPAHLTLDEARDWLKKLKAARAAGPNQLRKVERDLRDHLAPRAAQGDTIFQVAERFLETLATRRKRPEEARDVIEMDILGAHYITVDNEKKRVVDNHILGNKRLAELTKRDCREVVERVVKRGAKSYAGKVLGLLRQLLDYCENVEDGFTNPIARLKASNVGVEHGIRKRWLTEAELPIFWKALDRGGPPPTTEVERQYRSWQQKNRSWHPKNSAALRLLLLLGVRSNELRLARRCDLDLEAGTWTIPPEHQKLTPKLAQQARPLVIPLGTTARGLFEELVRIADEESAGDEKPTEPSEDLRPVLVSSESDSGLYDPKSLGKSMRRLWRAHPELKKLPEASPHDLRRTLRTHLAALGVEPHICERVLGHSLGGIIRVYDKHDYFPERRAALEKWDLYLRRLINPEGNNVIPFLKVSKA